MALQRDEHLRPTWPVASTCALLALSGCWELKPATDRRDASSGMSPPVDVFDAEAVDARPEPDIAHDTVTPDIADTSMDSALDAGPNVTDAGPADTFTGMIDRPDVTDTSTDRATDTGTDTGTDSLAPPRDVMPEASAADVTDVPVVRDVPVDSAPRDVYVPPDIPAVVYPAQPIAPPSGGKVFRADPVFEVEIPTSADGAAIEVCDQLDCGAGHVIRTFNVAQSSPGRARGRVVPTALAPGRYWWRAYATTGGARGAVSPTWRFRVLSRASASDAVGPGSLDVDNNGFDDFVVFCDGWKLYRGNPSVTPAALTNTPVALTGMHVATGDFNGDGFGDLATIPPNGAQGSTVVLRVYLGGRDGFSETPWTYSFETDLAVHSLASAGDFNRDGRTDLVLDRRVSVAEPRVVTVVYGGPNGLRLGPSLGGLAPVVGTMNASHVGAAGVGDVTGDGAEDLAVGIPSLPGGGYPASARIFSYGRLDAAAPAATYSVLGSPHCAGDVNGDGRFDIVVAHERGAALVFSSGASPIFQVGAMVPWPWTASADFNNNGFDDLVVAGNYGTAFPGVAVYYRGTSAGFEPGSSLIARESTTDYADAVAAGDYNGDSYPDFILRVSETVGGVPQGSLKFFRGASLTVSTTPWMTVPGCLAPVAW